MNMETLDSIYAQPKPVIEFKHTPGPWYVHDSTGINVIYGNIVGTFDIRNKPVGEPGPSLWMADVKPYSVPGFTDKETAFANAKLIAAAPDLLKAIQQALNIKDLWAPTGDVSVEHEGEAQALQSMLSAFESAIDKATK